MFLLTELTAWQRGFDSNKRVHKRDIWDNAYRLFLINPNRIVDLKVDGTGSMFLFSDNHRDRRENLSFVKSNSSVAEVITAHDLPFHSNFITLEFYPKNNPHKSTIEVTLAVEDIAYFDDYNDPDHPDCVWCVYTRKGFRRVEQLVKGTLENVYDRLLTGTTSTTTTSTEQR